MKKKIIRTLSTQVIILALSVTSSAQTIAEKYNFNFSGEGSKQEWVWVQQQSRCSAYIDSTRTMKGDNPSFKISYEPFKTTDKSVDQRMEFIASRTIVLPKQLKGDKCQISFKSITKEISNAWFTVTAIDCNEKEISTGSTKIEHPEWAKNTISIKLTKGRDKARALRINIYYIGNSNPEQQIGLSSLQIEIDGEDFGKQNAEDQSVIDENIHKKLTRKKMVKLSHNNDSTLFTQIDDLKDKKIIGLGECTHGSQETKTAFIQFSKNLIQNGNCKIILIEAPVDVMLLADLYVQGVVPDIEKQIEGSMRLFYTDYIQFMDFIKWLKKHNETSLQKVHLSGMDSDVFSNLYFYDYLLAVLGEEKGRYYLLKLHDKKYEEMLRYALNDTYLKEKLGEESFAFLITYIETCIGLENNPMSNTSDSRDFYMFTYTKRIADHFLKGNEKLIIYGHSEHIANLEMFDLFPYKKIPIGNRLKEYYGDKYYSISFQVGEGTITQESAGYLSQLTALPLSKPPYDSFEHLALNTKEDYFYYPSKYLKEDIIHIADIPRMARYRDQYQFHSVKNLFDAYVFIRKSTPLKNFKIDGPGNFFIKHLIIEKLIKDLKENKQ